MKHVLNTTVDCRGPLQKKVSKPSHVTLPASTPENEQIDPTPSIPIHQTESAETLVSDSLFNSIHALSPKDSSPNPNFRSDPAAHQAQTQVEPGIATTCVQ